MLSLTLAAVTTLLVPLVWWWRPRSLLVPAAVALFALAPLASGTLTARVVEAHGCTYREALVEPCAVRGRDLGTLLTEMNVYGWFQLVSVPAGIVLLVGWASAALLRWTERDAASPPDHSDPAVSAPNARRR